MNYKYVLIVAIMSLLIAGCVEFFENAVDPNSTQNKVIAGINTAAEITKENASALGPLGIPVAGVATLITALIGIYNNHRKKLTINEGRLAIGGQIQAYNNLKITASMIVDAIESLGEDPVGIALKLKVKERLKDKEIYQMGKAIIAGLKK